MMNTKKMIGRRLLPGAIASMVLAVIVDIYEYNNSLPSVTNLQYFASWQEFVFHGDGSTPWAFLIYLTLALAYGWMYLADKRNHYVYAIGSRTSLVDYRKQVLLLSFLIAFCLMFIRERICFWYSYSVRDQILLDPAVQDYLFEEVMLNHSYLYFILYGAWQALFHALYAVLAVLMSFYTKSLLLVTSSYLVYRLGIDFIAAYLPFYPIGSPIVSTGFNSFYGDLVGPGVIFGFFMLITVLIIIYRLGEAWEVRKYR